MLGFLFRRNTPRATLVKRLTAYGYAVEPQKPGSNEADTQIGMLVFEILRPVAAELERGNDKLIVPYKRQICYGVVSLALSIALCRRLQAPDAMGAFGAAVRLLFEEVNPNANEMPTEMALSLALEFNVRCQKVFSGLIEGEASGIALARVMAAGGDFLDAGITQTQAERGFSQAAIPFIGALEQVLFD